ncbi:MAG: hypothetical protein IPK81_24700 [Rhodospirillales bacterium]|nr:MAG: hypothetical protein IPK81_24700 [Rhodospirillales bacterium]
MVELRPCGTRTWAHLVLRGVGLLALASVLFAATPSPADACMRYQLAYFGYGSADLTDAARITVKQVAIRVHDYPPGCQIVRIVAHIDGAEAAAGFSDLDMRRALAIRAYLERLGIDQVHVRIGTRAFSNPYLPTEAGVRSPHNRRAEVGRESPTGTYSIALPGARTERFNGTCPGASSIGVRVFLRDGTECVRVDDEE